MTKILIFWSILTSNGQNTDILLNFETKNDQNRGILVVLNFKIQLFSSLSTLKSPKIWEFSLFWISKMVKPLNFETLKCIINLRNDSIGKLFFGGGFLAPLRYFECSPAIFSHFHGEKPLFLLVACVTDID